MEGWTWPWAWGFLSIPQEWPRKHSDKSSIDFFLVSALIYPYLSRKWVKMVRYIFQWFSYKIMEEPFRASPGNVGKIWENKCSSIFCLKNGVTQVTPEKVGNFHGDDRGTTCDNHPSNFERPTSPTCSTPLRLKKPCGHAFTPKLSFKQQPS